MQPDQPANDSAMAPRPARPSRRRLFVAGAAAALPAAAAVDGLLIEPRRLATTAHAVASRRAGAAGGGRPLEILQVSDLHLRRLGVLEEKVLAALHAARADVVVFTGDTVDRREGLWVLETFLRDVPRGPQFFAIVGNWERWAGIPDEALSKIYRRHGVELLVNRSVTFDADGRRVRVTGLDDLVAGRPDPSGALAHAEPCENHLLLVHCPAARDQSPPPPDHAADFMLSGHTHGGQVAPLGIAPVLPEGSGGYVAGWYRDGAGPPLYVSRGIGTSVAPVRIGATPELARFTWTLAGPA